MMRIYSVNNQEIVAMLNFKKISLLSCIYNFFSFFKVSTIQLSHILLPYISTIRLVSPEKAWMIVKCSKIKSGINQIKSREF